MREGGLTHAPVPAPVGLRVMHETLYHYGAPVNLARHLAHLRPRDNTQQPLLDWQLDVTPLPDEANGDGALWVARQSSVDRWGNHRTVFSHSRHHDELRVVSRFDVQRRHAPADTSASPPWETVADVLRYRVGGSPLEATEFSLPSWFAPANAALAAFARRAFGPRVSVAAGATSLMHAVHASMTYQPGSTHVGTRAPEALAQGQGVCQDLAHVMISACRSLGLAARYVSGYLLTSPPPGQARLVGADASHAWVQVWCPQAGWLALDPTNAIEAGADHVTVAWGRDYADVAPLRGVVQTGGPARVAPRVQVQVERVA